MLITIRRLDYYFRVTLSIVIVVALSLSIQYYNTEIYYKQKPKPFSGDYLYNPYEDYKPNPIKANFHTHSAAFLGLTNGSQEPHEVYSHYHKNGYDIISLSNYQKITNDTGNSNYIPVYEHGYSIRKCHQLVINAHKVSYFDFPLFQTYHHKQQVLKKLQHEESLIAIAHPLLLNGYDYNDFIYLKGYHLIEIFNNRKSYIKTWDKALENGYLVWLIANDDSHNINRHDHTFVSWTRIGATNLSKKSVLNALAKGCHYGVKNIKNKEYNQLDSCKLKGNTLTVYFKNKAQSIVFISNGGSIQKTEYQTNSATYTIKPSDRYVRIEANSENEIICLNPIVRYDGEKLPYQSAFPPVNVVQTILFRFMVLMVNSILFILLLLVNPNFKSQLFRRIGNLRQIKLG